MNHPLQVAYFCALAPLSVGTTIFFSWLLLRWDTLMLAGILTIYVGTLLFLVGVVSLSAHWFRMRQNGSANRQLLTKKSVLVALLLVINWPLAFFYASTAINIETGYCLVIFNNSKTPVEVIVSGGGIQVDFGTLAPSTQSSDTFHFDRDGELTIQSTQNGNESSYLVEGYVTPGIGGSKQVIIQSDGKIQTLELD